MTIKYEDADTVLKNIQPRWNNMQRLTDKQLTIYKAIKQYIDQYHGSPTITFLAKQFNMRGPSMNNHLNALEKKGYIKRTTLISNIEILK